jgi:AP endonuclease-2
MAFQPFTEPKRDGTLRIITWNINGIRAAPARLQVITTLQEMIDRFDADIVCLQETKLTRDQLDHNIASLQGYNSFFSFSRLKDGYSGVATYCKANIEVYGAEEGLSGTHLLLACLSA